MHMHGRTACDVSRMESHSSVPRDVHRYPTEGYHSMKHIPIALALALLCSCTPQSGGNYDATYQQQLDDYDRQTEQTQKQLDQTQELQDETERQLQRSKTQADRFDVLLDRWEEQADRQDKVLDVIERVLTRENAGDPSDNP
jgi:septal ring factor EnvC (AmiA/AmiB activator)